MTSERTLNQVRAILNKLDRSIDEARERRTHPGSTAAPATSPSAQPAPTVPGSPASARADEPASREASPFGRARPLNRPSTLESWRM